MTNLLLRLFVKDYKNLKSPDVRSCVGILSGGVGIFCNLLLCVLKFIVGTISSSVSIMADALNNMSDAVSSVVTLIGFKLAKMPADEDHPYGHARYEYLSGLAVAAMILIIGFELGKTSVEKIIHPSDVDFSIPVLIVLAGSVVVKLWLYLFNNRLGRNVESSAIIATGQDSRNDAIATTTVLCAGLIQHFSGFNVDGIMGLLVAMFILYSGIGLAKETISPLLGENASPELCELIVNVVNSEESVLGYHDLMVHDYGPGQRFASIHVEMDSSVDPLWCHELIDNLERDCLEKHNVHLVIHYDPIVTDDEELAYMKDVVARVLKKQDERITIHDFRMVRASEFTNLIFDIALPAHLMSKKREIKKRMDEDLANSVTGKYYTVVEFDMASFNQ